MCVFEFKRPTPHKKTPNTYTTVYITTKKIYTMKHSLSYKELLAHNTILLKHPFNKEYRSKHPEAVCVLLLKHNVHTNYRLVIVKQASNQLGYKHIHFTSDYNYILNIYVQYYDYVM
jgi:hypothetical protein